MDHSMEKNLRDAVGEWNQVCVDHFSLDEISDVER